MNLSQWEIGDSQYDDAQWAKMNLPSENSYKDIFLPYVGYREGINGLFGTENGDFRSYRYGYELTIGIIHDGDIIYVNGEKWVLPWLGVIKESMRCLKRYYMKE